MIPVNTPSLNGNELKYLTECIHSGWISSEGPFISEFETKFAAKVNRKYGISVSNGTAAIDAAIESCNLQKGDEVILPSFTIISCIAQILRVGAVPIFVDSDPITWNMDISQIEEKITDRTRIVMAVHIYGLPVDMDPLLELTEKYGLLLIEDSAEAHGQLYKGRPCGSFGALSTFSFYANKHITTGEGGMVMTNDDKFADSIKSLRNLCFQPERRFIHERLGWNLRMTNMQAAIGLAQLERLDDFIIKKRKMGKLYTELLSEVKCLQLPLSHTDYAVNNYWVFGMVINTDVEFDANYAIERLRKKGIGCRNFFYPLHLQPVLKNYVNTNDSLPVCENLYSRGFYVPSGLGLSEEEIIIVCNSVKEVFQ